MPRKSTGLKPDDWVVVSGLPQLQPGIPIQRDELKQMPTLASSDAGTNRTCAAACSLHSCPRNNDLKTSRRLVHACGIS